MTKLLAVFVALVSFPVIALAQAVPVPFTSVIQGTYVGDAGDFAQLTVHGDAGVGNNFGAGTLTSAGDAGISGNLNVGNDVTAPIVNATTYVQTPGVYGSTTFDSNGGGLMNFKANSVVKLTVNPTGVQIGTGNAGGNGGTMITNIGFGVCQLSSQTCNVALSGVTGSSVCHAFLLGPNSSTLGCDATADAGSATIVCGAATTGDAGVYCLN